MYKYSELYTNVLNSLLVSLLQKRWVEEIKLFIFFYRKIRKLWYLGYKQNPITQSQIFLFCKYNKTKKTWSLSPTQTKKISKQRVHLKTISLKPSLFNKIYQKRWLPKRSPTICSESRSMPGLSWIQRIYVQNIYRRFEPDLGLNSWCLHILYIYNRCYFPVNYKILILKQTAWDF